MLLFLFLLAVFFLCLGIKLVGWSLRLIYVVLIGIPCAIVLSALGIALCCTVLFIPLGKGVLHLAGWMVCPF